MPSRERAFLFWATVAALLLVSRLCHAYVLWADEDYHMAAAIQILHGKMLYRDLWYDKPPLAALLSLLFGGRDGWPLRVAGSMVAFGSCAMVFGVASRIWSRREGYYAAALLAFFLIFYTPTAVIPFEPDTVMILPHLAAVYFALGKRPLAAGALAGVAFLLSPKGAFVAAACLAIHPTGWLPLLAGFALPNLAAVAWLGANGALHDYAQQVWTWGLLYVGRPGSDPQAQHAWSAVPNWLGFHAALLIGSVPGWSREDRPMRWRLLAWAGISFAATAVGWRFAPRYFDQVLPALVVPAAGGIAMIVPASPSMRRHLALAAIALALLIPVLRFGPRYFTLASDSLMDVPIAWSDAAMDQESRTAAILLRATRRPGDTLFIWGYRPNLIVYTGLPVASKFWDSQPLTGVPADRHLSDSRPVAPQWAHENRLKVAQTGPAIIIDGLSAYNPRLDIHSYPELAAWLARYCVVLRVRNITAYRRCTN